MATVLITLSKMQKRAICLVWVFTLRLTFSFVIAAAITIYAIAASFFTLTMFQLSAIVLLTIVVVSNILATEMLKRMSDERLFEAMTIKSIQRNALIRRIVQQGLHKNRRG